MISKINSNPNFRLFVAYSLSFISYGTVITGLGPLIPYLAYRANQLQTQFSFLFFYRAIGFLLAGFAVNYLQKIMKLHTILIIASILAGLSLTWFIFVESKFYLALTICIASFFCCSLEIVINVSMLLSHLHYDQQFWLQLNHGMFGIGGLIGPIIVYFFELKSFMVMGILMMIMSPLYFILKSPDEIQVKQEDSHKKYQIASKSTAYYLLVLFFIYVGLQCTYGGWISSYAVLQNVSTKQVATSYSSLFWILMTLFRFIFACIPGKVSQKMYYLEIGCFSSLLISTLLVTLDLHYLAIIFSGVTCGLFFAPMFPLLLSLPYQFNMSLSVSQSAKIMIAVSFGQAFLSMFTGQLMGIFTPKMLFYSLLVYSISHFLIFIKFIEFLKSLVGKTSLSQNLIQQFQMKKVQTN